MCDGPVAAAHKGWVGIGKRHGSSRERSDLTWDCWMDFMRQGLRLAEWRKAGNRRRDMKGIESTGGIDQLATTKVVNGTKIPPKQRNDLRELLCGCVWTQKRQFDRHRAESPLCLFCTEEPEDEERILWGCPRWGETLSKQP